MSFLRDPRTPLAAASVLGAVVLLAAFTARGGVVAWLSVVGALLAGGSLLMASGRVAAPYRGAWRYLAVGALGWAVGTAIRTLLGAVDSVAVALTFGDLFVLAGVVLLTIGAVMAAARPARARTLINNLIDAYLCAAALFVIGWVTLLASVYRTSGEAAGTFGLKLMLPLACLLATCAVTPMILSTRGQVVGLMTLLTLAAVTVGEVAITAARLKGGVAPVFAGAAFLLLAAAPWSGRRSRSVDSASSDTPSHLPAFAGLLPALLVGVATLVVVVRALASTGRTAPVLPIVAGSIVVILLVRVFVLRAEAQGMRRLVDTGEQHLRDLAENTGDVVILGDHDGVVRYVSDGVRDVYGYEPAELVGRALGDLVHPEDLPEVEQSLRAFVDDERTACRVAGRVRAADGTWRPIEAVATPYSHRGDEELTLVTVRDVTDQVALRRQLTHLTFHDGVTGLPNRAYFEERTRELLSRRAPVAVIFLDLDGFTAVNDSIGHASGDYLLGQAARRLRAAVRVDDTVARWGGDEFAALVDSASAVDLAERLVLAMSAEPFRVAGRDVALTASVGVAFADSELGAGELIRNADVAMARAKELGGRRVEVFAAHMHTDVVRRLEIAADLQRALLENQFAVEYQPLVDLATSRVTSVEALVRWWRGSTFVPPHDFLGPAEDTGLIVPLGEWVLAEACREVAAWRASAWDIGLSVNLSARQITAPRFVETVSHVLAESGLPASALTLEVKEETLVEDASEIVARLSSLRALGVRLAIDDFGTGYASLAFLRQLPVDMIKVDPSFVAGLGRDETLTLLTRTIVRLGHDLGLTVVAEGIERPEQLELLREMGCTRGQGYLVARPMAARRVDSLVRTNLKFPITAG